MRCFQRQGFLRLSLGGFALKEKIGTWIILGMLGLLGLAAPESARAADCRASFQDRMIELVNEYRNPATLGKLTAISSNAQLNSQYQIAYSRGGNFYAYPGYTQVYYYGDQQNTEVLLNGQWVIANTGGNWGYVNPAGVLNKLKASQSSLLLKSGLTKIGIGCEQIDAILNTYTYGGFTYRTHRIVRAWTIGMK